MNDVLISYSREDRPRAEKFAKELTRYGFSVWWDRKIPPGKKYEDVILEALKTAKCVIVLWSKTSVASDWVKAEAEVGIGRKVLIPVLIDKVNVPIGFSRIEAADLTNWKPRCAHQDFEHLLLSVEALTGRKRKKEKAPPTRKKRKAIPPVQIRFPETRVWIFSILAVVALIAMVVAVNKYRSAAGKSVGAELSLNLKQIVVHEDGADGKAPWVFDIFVLGSDKETLARRKFKSFAYDDKRDDGTKPRIYDQVTWKPEFTARDSSITVQIRGNGPEGRTAEGRKKVFPGKSVAIPVVVAGDERKGNFRFEFELSAKKIAGK